MPGDQDEPPVVVLTNARSGSTLLRFLLDAHPDIASPAESRITRACADLLQAAEALGAGETAARDTVRRAVAETVRPYLATTGKRIWAEKSLWALERVDAVHAVWPDAAFVCLYRDPMDFIASATDSCRWGFFRYGFDAYVHRRPDNFVAGLADYWVDRTRTVADFEGRIDTRTHRVRYEDLVSSPRATLRDLFGFIGVGADDATIEACLTTSLRTGHGGGAGDSEIGYRYAVDARSVGRGRAVPVSRLEEDARSRLNELGARLGYPVIDDRWNVGSESGSAEPDERQRRLERRFRQRLSEYTGPPSGSLEIRLASRTGGRCRWLIDPARGAVTRLAEGDPAAPVVFQTHVDAAEEIVAGHAEISLSVAFGVVQELTEVDGQPHRSENHLLRALLS